MRKYKKRFYIPITKYNPTFRDANGLYQKEEWTSYFDIGKTFNNIFLEKKEYEDFEKLYIDAVLLIINYFNARSIKIKHLLKLSDINDFEKNNDTDLYEVFNTIKEGEIIKNHVIISKILKLRLREYIGELELIVDIRSRSEIIFGFDFYMYLKTNLDVKALLSQIKDIGLFVA